MQPHEATPGRAPPPPSQRTGIEYVEPDVVAAVLKVSEAMLERWRRDLPGGPPWYRFGPRSPRYILDEVHAWAATKRVDGARSFPDDEPEKQQA